MHAKCTCFTVAAVVVSTYEISQHVQLVMAVMLCSWEGNHRPRRK